SAPPRHATSFPTRRSSDLGFGGQSFIPAAIPKIRQVRALIDAQQSAGGREVWLEVDGGIKVDNVGDVAAAGADTFVAGSAVFGRSEEHTSELQSRENLVCR